MNRIFKAAQIVGLTSTILLTSCTANVRTPSVELAESVKAPAHVGLLEEVVTQYPSEHVERVIYDPDTHQYMVFSIEKMHERMDDEHFWRDFYIEKFGVGVDDPTVDAFLKKVTSDPKYKQGLSRSIFFEHIDNENYLLQNVGAIALKIKDYGVGKKTPVYVFSKSFEPDTLDTKYGVIDFPLISGVKEKYLHETFHAEHNALGIPLSSGQRMGPELYASTHLAVTDFIGELAAHRQTYEQFESEGTDEHAEFLALERMMLYVMQNAPDMIRWAQDSTFSEPDAELFLSEYRVCLKGEEENRRSFDRLNKKLSVAATK